MEHELGLDRVEQLAHANLVAHVGDGRLDQHAGKRVHQLAMDLEQRVLEALDEHEPGWPEAAYLPAQLRADAAARTGHEHDAATDTRADDLFVEMHRLAAEQVLDRD